MWHRVEDTKIFRLWVVGFRITGSGLRSESRRSSDLITAEVGCTTTLLCRELLDACRTRHEGNHAGAFIVRLRILDILKYMIFIIRMWGL